ncbi:hypothetical protein [Moraxella catarrhalis]|uniref:hypothetical protein n=1 Tax=Moraxella catarrhalis TaxID=480 RepID=UPI000202AD6E|nr:hypothetical protein [Moraxella catarrhalis]EGE13428.1 hypothetical protein E9K_06039 [Moraxella catarrhalis 103P14B1]MPX52190.1 hypothetical protein [Moraxella catarrhalis]MPX68756.1 hypothetical protein [Moraxella catarrhalis]MPX85512.1 hypothetical protein [Moraxella catarrhalis]
MTNKIPKDQLIAVAESFAGVSPFADACYRYYFYQDKACHAHLSSCLAVEFAEYLTKIPTKHHQPIINTALIEISYPQKNLSRSTFCAKERACCMGISRRQYYNLHAGEAIDNIIGNITGIAKVVAGKVREQLGINLKLGY